MLNNLKIMFDSEINGQSDRPRGHSSGINNLVMSWNFKKLSSKTSTRRNLFLWTFIGALLILDAGVRVAHGAPSGVAATHLNSRSIRDNSIIFKNIQPTTLHSLQGVGDSGSSLSIVSSLDVLRQNMVMEIMRRRIRHAKQRQLQSNKEILDRIG